MSKTLIIAEKPSVATDLSKVLLKAPGMTKFEKKGADRNTYFENDTAIITSAVGHLVELKMPLGPNGKNLPWKFDVLPAIPKKFQLQASEKTESRLKQIIRLAKRKDVSEIINACDAGREGELIFRYILDFAEIKKPEKRLWMRSMTNQAILEAWGTLREGQEMTDLTDAAKCRSESDWLVGLNATRALTCFSSRHGGFNMKAAGRVQTPTLAILAKREHEILNFVQEPYSEVHADFDVSAGSYQGKWFDEKFKKIAGDNTRRAERIWIKQDAEAILERCQGKQGLIEETKKPKKEASPLLYDLTSLQRDASKLFGYSARRTLQLAQALYERHKMLTYPRTDSKYLPEDYIGTVYKTMEDLTALPVIGKFAKKNLDEKQIIKTKKVFNNDKVSDHFAIIPTGRTVKLGPEEQKVYDLVTKRFISIFYPPAEFLLTNRITRIDHADYSDAFKTDGRVLTVPGWRAVYGSGIGADELIPVEEGETAETTHLEILSKTTNPPTRFNEATLLSAMETAGKLIDNEELKEAMSERGLGTPATRAATIEGLISHKYLLRDGRELHVTPSGLNLIALIEELDINTLSSPTMTGDWEFKLREMEVGKFKRDDFMQEILSFTTKMVEKAKVKAEELKNKVFPDLEAPCPMCQAPNLRQTDATYECYEAECKFKAKRYIAGRLLSDGEACQLFTTKFVGPLTGFKSRFNQPFDAALELDEKFKVNFKFDDGEEEEELSEDQLVGVYPIHNSTEHKVYATAKSVIIPSLIVGKNKDAAKISRHILSKELSQELILELLTKGKTPLIDGFVSKRTKRAFSAHLLYDSETGKVSFEFEARKPSKKAAKKGARKAAKKATKKATKKSS